VDVKVVGYPHFRPGCNIVNHEVDAQDDNVTFSQYCDLDIACRSTST
jgi:hypothetical protein